MNPDTGNVAKYFGDELMKEQQERAKKQQNPLIELEQEPNPKCPLCGGRGSIRKRKHFYKPCLCTRQGKEGS